MTQTTKNITIALKPELELEAKAVRQYIAFDGSGKQDDSPQAVLQSTGVAALWHRIEEDNFAYLADEVGMGKTRQAMGVIASQFLRKPDSRVVVICPGKPLQDQWKAEWATFIKGCLLRADGILKSPLDDQLLMPMVLHERLNQFAKSALLDHDRIHLLRYSSFSRPIGFQKDKKIEAIQKTYHNNLKTIGIAELSADELTLIKEIGDKQKDWRTLLTGALNSAYAKRLKTLLRDEARPIDLVVCDEAQYLRHTGNARNRHIRASLASRRCKWLFLSATPLHSGQNDIKSLDHYLCPEHRHENGLCQQEHCTNIKAKMEGTFKGQAQLDAVDILSEFLVRRPRQYIDGNQQQYDKVAYRRYQPDKAIASNDAFASIVTALVQKNLVKSLSGNNNRFRQGECSSFESLASSAGNKTYKDCDGIERPISEYEGNESATKEEAPDRFAIDELNRSLRRALVNGKQVKQENAGQVHLPHTKLYHVVDALADKCLKNAPNHKTLVFVRRLDTVVELQVLLQQRFQQIVDQRIDNWATWLNNKNGNITFNHIFHDSEEFWHLKDKIKDDHPVIIEDEEGNEDDSSAISRASKLAYFQAVSQKSGIQQKPGMLHSFKSQLLQTSNKSNNSLAFLIPDDDTTQHWSDPNWQAFIGVIYEDGNTFEQQWMFCEHYANDIKTLKRCLLQSMRNSDFLVDLYILHHSTMPQTSLTDKLLWLFEQAKTDQLVENSHKNDCNLTTYLNNWRQRLTQWCDHFSLIAQKCFNRDANNHINNIDNKFSRMGPILARSGSIANQNAVTQFKMPCYPNILVCTDVLKEGVDMHLFCDEVIHYGVAWTSGDLEQRIGRVDRVNSLIHRRILAHKPDSNEHNQHNQYNNSAPRLNTGFPYLAGTLDQHQVNRVIKRKLLSDLQMDFGKRRDDVKDLSISDLLSDDVAIPANSNRHQAREFLPATLSLSGPRLCADNFASELPREQYADMKTKLDIAIANRQLHNITYQSLHPIHGIILNHQPKDTPQSDYRKTLGDNLKSQWHCGKNSKKAKKAKGWFESFSCIVPLTLSQAEVTQAIDELLMSGKTITPTSINSLTGFDNSGFTFNKTFNTIAITHNEHIAPHQQTDNRRQTVILENIGDQMLLRSPIITIDDLKRQDGALAQWIGEKNNNLSFGYLNDHAGIIWFCTVVAYPHQFGQHFTALTNKVSDTADRLQQIYTASDDETWHYKAADSVRELFQDSRNNAAFLALIDSNRKVKKAISCWQESILKEVARAIADEIGIDEIKLNEAFKHLTDNKRLKKQGWSNIAMPDKPKLRFQLQSYLDINDPDANTSQDFPMIYWELAINIKTTGNRPLFELDDWQGLPHNDNEADWNTLLTTEDIKVLSFQSDNPNNRWLMLCHPAYLLDGHQEAFIDAWSRVAWRMKNNEVFSKQQCAADFERVWVDK